MNTFDEQDPYQHLALRVIRQAQDDFHGRGLPNHGISQKYKGWRRRVLLLRQRLINMRTRVSAGHFLLTRNDPVVRLWFGWNGMTRNQISKHPKYDEMMSKLAELEQSEIVLKRQLTHAIMKDTGVVVKAVA